MFTTSNLKVKKREKNPLIILFQVLFTWLLTSGIYNTLTLPEKPVISSGFSLFVVVSLYSVEGLN